MKGDWKLRLRYGKTKTPFKHFTVLANGIAEKPIDEFNCQKGKAWMAMKTWSSSAEETKDIILSISSQIGFKLIGKIEVYKTDPVEPPKDKPFGYDINFVPYDE